MTRLSVRRAADRASLFAVMTVAVALWLPRLNGPIDLRWDGGVHYILGTSLAQGQGYRLLNEPGRIEAIQYPPLLPAVVAVHQRLLGTADPTVVGRWLRATTFAVFLAFAAVVWRLLRSRLPAPDATLGAFVSLLSLQTWFLSDALYPEIWFGLATLLFIINAGKDTRRGQTAAYVSALVGYGLRTIGIVAFIVWALEAVLRGRLKQAAVRTALALVPVVAWQGYVATVERSAAYVHPAYDYQRAPYQFYNVSYATNIALRDPFTPEKGKARTVRRIVRNAFDLPANLGEALSVPRGYYESALHALLGKGTALHAVIVVTLLTVLSIAGVVLVGGGTALQLLGREITVPMYLGVYLAAILATPFPGQYLRYLMPVTPLLALTALLFLRSLKGRSTTGYLVLGPAVILQLGVAGSVYATEHPPVQYRDARGQLVAYRLFFYNDTNRGFDEAVTYLGEHAHPPQIVASGTPHWVYLRTGLTTVMPPFERDTAETERLLEGVPVEYLLVGNDVVGSERYSRPAVREFSERWRPVYSTSAGGWVVYRRLPRDPAPVLVGGDKEPSVEERLQTGEALRGR